MLPIPLLHWQPSHVLIWTPRFGAVRSWLVRVIATTTDGGQPAVVAQTADEDRHGRTPDWIQHGEGPWRWQGMSGYRGEAGAVELERLED